VTSERIKELARELGFDAAAIASAEPLEAEIQRYDEWIARGYHGTMAYMERNRESRYDVRTIVPEARSVIVLAKNYFTPHRHVPSQQGKIARYAWGDDYHDVLPPLLDELCARIQAIEPDSRNRRYTDTGPVLEKQWAVRAGLGWQGKNGNIIRRDIGSWFFIGVIITTIDLVPDSPMEDYCGTCTACLDLCPTSAIVEPSVVDATRCISYWTIEAKADVEIPLPIAQNLDGWLFGCDVCQDVCPWNRFETPCDEPRFEPRREQVAIDPEEVLTLQPISFAERFRRSPIKRAKLGGLRRTARALRNPKQEI
jgi:epoxyqueuosine reductase